MLIKILLYVTFFTKILINFYFSKKKYIFLMHVQILLLDFIYFLEYLLYVIYIYIFISEKSHLQFYFFSFFTNLLKKNNPL